jgi:ketosteroid isomerase-like protein
VIDLKIVMYITFRSAVACSSLHHQTNSIAMKNLMAISSILILLQACTTKDNAQEKSDPLAEVKIMIAESNALYFTSFVKNDSAIFVNRYAEDACIMAPGSPQLCGRQAAADFFRLAYHEFGLRDGKFITTSVYGDGKEYVTEEGIWQSFDANNNMFDDGKFLVLWKKTTSGWKMYRDSFSSNHNNP